MPINRGEFNDLLEEHIENGMVPTSYVSNRNPIDDDLWIMTHKWPLSEQDRTFATISYPHLDFETLMSEAIIPVLTACFGLRPNTLQQCFERWKNCIKEYIQHRFSDCPESINSLITVTCCNISLCITMYPVIHDTPILVHDGDNTYSTSECSPPTNIIENGNMETANMAITTTATALAVHKKDPSLAEIGNPGNLSNYLPDSGATQHMTPR
jgi:hypothetical protein